MELDAGTTGQKGSFRKYGSVESNGGIAKIIPVIVAKIYLIRNRPYERMSRWYLTDMTNVISISEVHVLGQQQNLAH